MKKNWIITGVSTGLGREFSKAALTRGDDVVGTVRKQADADAFTKEFSGLPGKVFAVVCDVTKTELVYSAFAEAKKLLGGNVDILVNNAGYGLLSSIEQLPEEKLRHQMEVNFFGALEMTRAALPTMREQRSGTIVQISSMAGQLGAAGLGLYNASKWALEGFSEALSREVAHLGIRVIIVEPGAFRTDWAGRSLDTIPPLPDYEASVGQTTERLNKVNGNQQGDPVKAAAFLLELVDSQEPPLRIPFGSDSVMRIREKLQNQLQSLETWAFKSTSLSF